MFDFLEQLREKPLYYRKRVALLATTALTGLIFLVWVSTLDFTSNMTAIDGAAVENDLKPIDEIKTNIGSFYDSVKGLSAGLYASGTPNNSQ